MIAAVTVLVPVAVLPAPAGDVLPNPTVPFAFEFLSTTVQVSERVLSVPPFVGSTPEGSLNSMPRKAA